MFVWRANAAEQIEAAMREPFEGITRAAVAQDEWIMEALAMLKVGRDKGDDAKTIMRHVLAGFMLRVIGGKP